MSGVRAIDHDFVIWTDERWGEFDFRRYLIHCLADQLPESKFLCIERPVCPVVTPIKNLKRFAKFLRGRDNLRLENKNLFVFRPFVLLHDHLAANVPLVPALNSSLLFRQVDKAMNRLGLDETRLISWIYDPFQGECLGLMGEKFMIYESQHEYAVLPDDSFFRPKKEVIRREEQVLGKVDLIFVNSVTQIKRKKQYIEKIHVFPEAVPESFITTAGSESSIAHDLLNLPRPIIGLVGFVTPRIDFNLLAYLASTHPEWSLIWVGSTSGAEKELKELPEFRKLVSLPNLHLKTAKPLPELPPYLAAFDVCIIPYTVDPWSVTVFPTKLYLYLATGKPIVSVPISGAEAFKEVVKVAENYPAFEKAIVAALGERDEGLKERRKQLANENTWEQRAKDMVFVIQDLLDSRSTIPFESVEKK